MLKTIKHLEELTAVRAYLKRIGAEARSLRSAVITEQIDKYARDISTIRFMPDGRVLAKEHHMPNDEEKLAIQKEFSEIRLPELKMLPSLTTIPQEISDVPKDDIFEFRTKENLIIMLQVKRVDPKGEKYFLPYTFWDDGEWRRVEPEGGLPLFGLEHIKDNTTVFIHEGAKAARSVQRMIMAEDAEQKEALKKHPWGHELCAAVHIGWAGGALAPARTNWSMLNKLGIKQAYIVSDNDKAGISAVSAISMGLRMPTYHLQFTHEWPAAFDLADEFPEHMFKVLEEKPRYIGPPFRACLHPATWATDRITQKDSDRVAIELRDHFKDMWAYIEEADLYVLKSMPNIVRDEKILNNMMSSFSHTKEISKLILKEYSGRTTSLCYRPDRPEQIITNGNSSSINLHIPTFVRSEPGDPAPFLEFMKYMFPIEFERIEVERWCATMIARPEIRMEYGMLMVSEATGIGKTTLGSMILAPLVNISNVGFPREADILDNFNDWVSNKRLVIVHEIYSGHSWKAYHMLKSLITDKDINVNQKYQRPYKIENWAHIFACSNSMRALKMESDDRRWFYPAITEERWPREKFAKLRDWLASGGLGIIKTWAENYVNYVGHGERAPMTSRKKEIIEGSRSEAQMEAVNIAESLVSSKKPMAMAMKDIIGAIRDQVQGKVFDSDNEIRKAMVEAGAFAHDERLKIQGRMQYVIMNKELKLLVLNSNGKAFDLVNSNLIKPADLSEPAL